jgi:iron complex transport system permease protein
MRQQTVPKSPWVVLPPQGLRRFISFKINKQVPLVGLIILLLAFLVLVFSVSYGEYKIPRHEVVQTILETNTDHPDYDNYHLVVHTFRLPRIVLSFLVGMALATSGTILQGITRNPLAEPGILGISAGAGLTAVALIVYFRDIPLTYLPFAAFAGAIITAVAIYVLSWKRGATSPLRMVLIGVAMASGLGSITTILLTFGDIYTVQQAYLWLVGSVYGSNWEHVHALGGWMLVFIPLAWILSRQLNIIHLGDESAKGLGMKVERQRALLLLASVALASAATAVSGTIGFIGLIAPHAVRKLVGPAHEGLLPISALFGGTLLMLADLIGRWVIAPSEMPVGVVTGVIGAPYFFFLLYRHRNSM